MARKFAFALAFALSTAALAAPALAGPNDRSSGRRDQDRGEAQIPICTHKLGTVAIVPPDNNWWGGMGLGSPDAVLKVFVMKSGCFGLVDRGRGLQGRNVERALADNGELQAGSNIGRGQVRAADYLIVPDIVNGNSNSGGGGLGAALGGLGRRFGGTVGAVAGGIDVRKKEASVTLTLVNARTTEQERLTEGYYRKTDISWGGSGGVFWGGFAEAGASGYTNTDIGQVIVLAYLDAFNKLVRQLGGLPDDPGMAAPRAH